MGGMENMQERRALALTLAVSTQLVTSPSMCPRLSSQPLLYQEMLDTGAFHSTYEKFIDINAVTAR